MILRIHVRFVFLITIIWEWPCNHVPDSLQQPKTDNKTVQRAYKSWLPLPVPYGARCQLTFWRLPAQQYESLHIVWPWWTSITAFLYSLDWDIKIKSYVQTGADPSWGKQHGPSGHCVSLKTIRGESTGKSRGTTRHSFMPGCIYKKRIKACATGDREFQTARMSGLHVFHQLQSTYIVLKRSMRPSCCGLLIASESVALVIRMHALLLVVEFRITILSISTT